MRYAIVNPKGQVIHIQVVGSSTEWPLPSGHRLVPCSDDVGIGYSFDGKEFVATTSKKAIMSFHLYRSAYPILMSLFGISYVILMAGLVMFLIQAVSGHANPWKTVCLVGFMGTWFFPALIIALGVLTAKTEPHYETT